MNSEKRQGATSRLWVKLAFAAVLITAVLVAVLAIQIRQSGKGMPEVLPRDLRWSDDNHLRVGDFGTFAFLTPGWFGVDAEKMFCTADSVAAYGPFDYAGEYEEFIASKTVTTGVGKKEDLVSSDYTSVVLYIQPVQRESGDWLVIKRFHPGIEETNFSALQTKKDLNEAKELTLTKLQEQMSSLSFTVHRAPWGMTKTSLDEATEGIIDWQETDKGFIWQ